MNKVAVITGGSSGIGKCTAEALASLGCKVYELSRHEKTVSPGICHIDCDVTDNKSVENAIDRIIGDCGVIDILVNNAGAGISGAVEFTPTEEARRLFDVNFFGQVRLCNAVISHMRERGQGRIVNLSSVAAVVPIPFQTFYSATKAAVNSYSSALANEVRPFGISVCAVMPGDIKTGFTAARIKLHEGDGIYGGRISRSVTSMEKDEINGMDPAFAGKYIASIAMRKRVKPLYAIGFAYKAASLLAKLLPCGLLNRIIYKIYAS